MLGHTTPPVNGNISFPHTAPVPPAPAAGAAAVRPFTKADFDSQPTRPVINLPHFAMIPQELCDLRQWVLWRYDLEKGDDGKPHWRKVPYSCFSRRRGGKTRVRLQRAKTNNPRSWGDFDSLAAFIELYGEGRFGIGFVFTADSPFMGIDWDDALDRDTGRIVEPAVVAELAALNSYTEVSPSGTGLKTYLRAKKPGKCCQHKKEAPIFEAYDWGHWFAVTGRRLPDSPETLEPRQEAVNDFYYRHFPATTPMPPPPPQAPPALEAAADLSAHIHVGAGRLSLSDIDLLDKARSNGVFDGFWLGDRQGINPSQADYRLCYRLAFWTNRDADRTAMLFRQSGLYRPPPQKAADYPERTARAACSRQLHGYGDGSWKAAEEWETAFDSLKPTTPTAADAVEAMREAWRTWRLNHPADKVFASSSLATPQGPTLSEADLQANRDAQLARMAARLEDAIAASVRAETAVPLVPPPDATHDAAAAVCALIEGRITAAFELRPRRDERCQRGSVVGFYRKDNVREGFVGRLACGCLRCDYCRCRIHAYWKRRAATCVLHEVGPTGLPPAPRNRKLSVRYEMPLRTTPIYLWTGAAGQVRKIQKRIADACKAAAFTPAGGRIVDAFGDTATVVADVPFKDAEAVAPAAAAEKLSRLIDGARRGQGAISFWGRWKTPKVVKEYRAFGVTMKIEEAEDHIAAAKPCAFRTFTADEQSLSAMNGGFAWKFPEKMDKEDVLRTYAEMDANRPEGGVHPTKPKGKSSHSSYTAEESDDDIEQMRQAFNKAWKGFNSEKRRGAGFERSAPPETPAAGP